MAINTLTAFWPWNFIFFAHKAYINCLFIIPYCTFIGIEIKAFALPKRVYQLWLLALACIYAPWFRRIVSFDRVTGERRVCPCLSFQALRKQHRCHCSKARIDRGIYLNASFSQSCTLKPGQVLLETSLWPMTLAPGYCCFNSRISFSSAYHW